MTSFTVLQTSSQIRKLFEGEISGKRPALISGMFGRYETKRINNKYSLSIRIEVFVTCLSTSYGIHFYTAEIRNNLYHVTGNLYL